MATIPLKNSSPLEDVCRGAAAGLAATLMLSALSRMLPGMGLDPKVGAPQRDEAQPPPPRDPFNPAQVEEWQRRSQSPAAYRHSHEVGNVAILAPRARQANVETYTTTRGSSSAITPASALEQPESPGPEGIAEQFAFKVASALFNADITPMKKPVGMATHLTYGSFWGGVYGLLRSSLSRPPRALGALFGLGMWAIGPASLVPAMRLMRRPTEEPLIRTAMMVLGHIAYGVALAEAYEAESRRSGERAPDE